MGSGTIRALEIARTRGGAGVAIRSGRTTVATAGTAVALSAVSRRVGRIRIEALLGDAGVCYVGNDGASDVSSATGFVLYPATASRSGNYVEFECIDMADIYVDAATNGDGVCWIIHEDA